MKFFFEIFFSLLSWLYYYKRQCDAPRSIVRTNAREYLFSARSKRRLTMNWTIIERKCKSPLNISWILTWKKNFFFSIFFFGTWFAHVYIFLQRIVVAFAWFVLFQFILFFSLFFCYYLTECCCCCYWACLVMAAHKKKRGMCVFTCRGELHKTKKNKYTKVHFRIQWGISLWSGRCFFFATSFVVELCVFELMKDLIFLP